MRPNVNLKGFLPFTNLGAYLPLVLPLTFAAVLLPGNLAQWVLNGGLGAATAPSLDATEDAFTFCETHSDRVFSPWDAEEISTSATFSIVDAVADLEALHLGDNEDLAGLGSSPPRIPLPTGSDTLVEPSHIKFKTPSQIAHATREKARSKAKRQAARSANSKTDVLLEECPRHPCHLCTAGPSTEAQFDLRKVRIVATGWIGLRDNRVSPEEAEAGVNQEGYTPIHLLPDFFGVKAIFHGFHLAKYLGPCMFIFSSLSLALTSPPAKAVPLLTNVARSAPFLGGALPRTTSWRRCTTQPWKRWKRCAHCSLADERLLHRRGNWAPLTKGASFGGGQTEPVSNLAFIRFAGFATAESLQRDGLGVRDDEEKNQEKRCSASYPANMQIFPREAPSQRKVPCTSGKERVREGKGVAVDHGGSSSPYKILSQLAEEERVLLSCSLVLPYDELGERSPLFTISLSEQLPASIIGYSQASFLVESRRDHGGSSSTTVTSNTMSRVNTPSEGLITLLRNESFRTRFIERWTGPARRSNIRHLGLSISIYLQPSISKEDSGYLVDLIELWKDHWSISSLTYRLTLSGTQTSPTFKFDSLCLALLARHPDLVLAPKSQIIRPGELSTVLLFLSSKYNHGVLQPFRGVPELLEVPFPYGDSPRVGGFYSGPQDIAEELVLLWIHHIKEELLAGEVQLIQ
ncbi:hypothetical protein DFH09DRAFT_1087159 [Mycena vulgaris]|nr:hypothetical protein DFH09DRAFT_1087159 [Mycena vulgaris]